MLAVTCVVVSVELHHAVLRFIMRANLCRGNGVREGLMTTKKLIWLLIIAAVAYVTYQYYQSGEVDLPELDKGPRTPAEQALDDIEQRFQARKQRWEESALSDNELMQMRREAERMADELKRISPKLTKKTDNTTVGRLAIEIRKFKDEVL